MQTELPKNAFLLIITIIYHTIVNKHNATDRQMAIFKRKKLIIFLYVANIHWVPCQHPKTEFFNRINRSLCTNRRPR